MSRKGYTITDRTLALAGVHQAVYLVDQVARHGRCDEAEFETTIHSLFVTHPTETEQVYGSRHGIRHGLSLLVESLGKERNAQLIRYVITLLHLERKLRRQKKLMEQLSTGIDRARAQSEHFSTTHENVIANLADTYINTISTLKPRVMVEGDGRLLQHNEVANKVRALLLAGIRSAVLWRQTGGSQWQLFFKSGSLRQEAQRLLERG